MDYEQLGLKCGIEIHQQLEGRKLFCNCPTIIKDIEPDSKVERQLRAVVGETGEIDTAALHEQERRKNFVYNYYRDACCLIELDEEPPTPISTEAVKTSLVVSKLLNASPVDEVQVMRKTVVDGSNTTGFQRTALVAMDGSLQAEDKEVGIETICLEEDAAKIVERGTESDVYNLSRLGIPLVEIATGPDMKSPEQVRIIAEKIGNILRSTGKCKRGLGTIRQDVNISVEKGNRVEIKGAQDLKVLPEVVEQEAERQKNLIEIKENIKAGSLKQDIVDLTDIFSSTEAKVIKKALKNKGVVYGVKLPGFSGFLGREIQKGRRLGSELSDYAKVKAGVGGIFHSDELPKYGITSEDVEAINKKLNIKDEAFVLIADEKNKAKSALNAVLERSGQVLEGVPKEVRKANEDGTTSYLRPLPGGARMYPETDVMPLKTDFDFELPELIEDKAARYEKEYALAGDLAKDMAKSEFNGLFERLCKDNSLKPGYVAEVLVSFPAELTRDYEGAEPGLVKEEDLESIFRAVANGEIAKSSVMDAIVDLARGEELELGKYKTISEEELEKEIKKIVEDNKGAPAGAIMGKVMQKFQGKADGKKVNELVKKYMNA